MDNQDMYMVNEVAINWNGALVYALALFLPEGAWPPPQSEVDAGAGSDAGASDAGRDAAGSDARPIHRRLAPAPRERRRRVRLRVHARDTGALVVRRVDSRRPAGHSKTPIAFMTGS
jgi:hypothetical protein